MRTTLFFSLPALLFSICTVAAAQQEIDINTLSESRVDQIEINKGTRPGKTVEAATIIDAPHQKLCAILLDYASYPSFMPRIDKVKVANPAPDHAIVDYTLKLPLGKVTKYRLKMEPKANDAACHIAWALTPWPELRPDETIVDTVGYWQLTPLASDKNKTVVKYHVYTDVGPVPLGLGWLVDSMGRKGIPETMEALRARVK